MTALNNANSTNAFNLFLPGIRNTKTQRCHSDWEVLEEVHRTVGLRPCWTSLSACSTINAVKTTETITKTPKDLIISQWGPLGSIGIHHMTDPAQYCEFYYKQKPRCWCEQSLIQMAILQICVAQIHHMCPWSIWAHILPPVLQEGIQRVFP